MSVLAVYENGVFRPLEPVALAEHRKVHLSFVEEADGEGGDRKSPWELFGKGFFGKPSEDFDAPLEDFKEYM